MERRCRSRRHRYRSRRRRCRSRRRRWHSRWVTVVTVAAVALASTGTATAHAIPRSSRFSAPLPLSLLFVGAGATVALTAIWLAVTGERDRPVESDRRLLTVSRRTATPIRYALGVAFLLVVVAALVLGTVGRQVAAENLATVFTWSVWFRGLALVAILVGNPWPVLSPWRTVYRGLRRLEGRELAVLGRYPRWLGAWPALGGFLVLIGVVENLTTIPRSPRSTALLIAVYALAMVGGAVCFGPTWLRRADPLEVLYRLLGRVAPVGVRTRDSGGYDVVLRPPWRGCFDPVPSVSLVVFVVAAVYTVSFDGFTNTDSYQAVLFAVRDGLGTGPGTSVLLYLAGLIGFVAAFGLTSWSVERLGTDPGADWLAAARRIAPTVLPIAAAYEVAHNYPYVARNAGQLLVIVLQPPFPSVESIQPLDWLPLSIFWGSQVGLIVLGHVFAVVAAHHVSVDRYGSLDAGRRAHAPLVVLMIAYTVLSLWIISQPVVAG